ncbi:MAG: hypothetical protein PHE24_01530 [Patescibacteria group bacterium]|nr:hypothetical protein [Patescibacteria group bacterium]
MSILARCILVLSFTAAISPLTAESESAPRTGIYIGYNRNTQSPPSAFAVSWTGSEWKSFVSGGYIGNFSFLQCDTVAFCKNVYYNGHIPAEYLQWQYICRAPVNIDDYPYDSSGLSGFFMASSCGIVINGQGYFSYGIDNGEISLSANSLVGVTRDSIRIWNGSGWIPSSDSIPPKFGWGEKIFSRNYTRLSIYNGSKYRADLKGKIQLVYRVSDTSDFICVLGTVMNFNGSSTGVRNFKHQSQSLPLINNSRSLGQAFDIMGRRLNVPFNANHYLGMRVIGYRDGFKAQVSVK